MNEPDGKSMHKAFKKFDLTGRTALITGAAGLLGREHAAALLESGATVVLTDINESVLEALRRTLPTAGDATRVLTRVMDVSRADAVRNTAESLDRETVRI